MQQRPLGPQEALFTELYLRAAGAAQLTVLARLLRPVPASELTSALAQVHERHPLLGARVEQRTDDRWWWVCDVPFSAVQTRTQELDGAVDSELNIDAVYATEAEQTMDIRSVCYRVTALTRSGQVHWILLTVNHAAVDGRAALTVLNEVEAVLSGQPTSAAPLPLPPAVEDCLTHAAAGGRNLLPPIPDEALWPVAVPVPAAERLPRATYRHFPKADLQRLHERMRGRGERLGAAFAAAIVPAAREFPGWTEWTPMLVTADLRKDCEPVVAPDSVGCFVGSLMLYLRPNQQHDSLSTTARVLAEQLTHERDAAQQLDATYDDAVIAAQADAIALAADRFSNGVCVSDVGDMSRLAGRTAGFDEVVLMPAQRHCAHPVMLVAITTTSGVHLTIGYAEPVTATETAHRFADAYLAALYDLAAD